MWRGQCGVQSVRSRVKVLNERKIGRRGAKKRKPKCFKREKLCLCVLKKYQMTPLLFWFAQFKKIHPLRVKFCPAVSHNELPAF